MSSCFGSAGAFPYTEDEPALTRRLTPASRAATRTLSVASTLARFEAIGSCTDRGTRRNRRLVQHELHAAHRPTCKSRVGEVALQELDSTQVVQVLALARHEVVGNANGVSTPDKLFGEMRPDKTCSTGDEV